MVYIDSFAVCCVLVAYSCAEKYTIKGKVINASKLICHEYGTLQTAFGRGSKVDSSLAADVAMT